MNRRGFFRGLFAAAVTAKVAPTIEAKPEVLPTDMFPAGGPTRHRFYPVTFGPDDSNVTVCINGDFAFIPQTPKPPANRSEPQ
jgi:hypothetical protein